MSYDATDSTGQHAVEIRPKHDRVRSVLIATLLGIIATILPGCAEGQRERHLASRMDFVMPQAGTGSTRLSLWTMQHDDRARLAQAINESSGQLR